MSDVISRLEALGLLLLSVLYLCCGADVEVKVISATVSTSPRWTMSTPAGGTVSRGGGEPMARVMLRLKGKAVMRATHIGFFKINSVKDNRGKSLRPHNRAVIYSETQSRVVSQDFYEYGKFDPRKSDTVTVVVRAYGVSQNATRLTLLQGSLRLVMPAKPEEVIIIDRIHEKFGKTLTNNSLQRAKVSLKLIDRGGDALRFYGVEVHAENTSCLLSIRSVQLVDGTGVELGRPTRAGVTIIENPNGGLKEAIVDYDFSMKKIPGGRRRVPPSMRQSVKIGEDSKLKIVLGLKQIVNVPFKIKNIPLVPADQ